MWNDYNDNHVDVASGVYIVHIYTDEFLKVKKMLIMK